MQFTQEELITICEQASTLMERISSQFATHESQKNRSIIDNRLEKWCHIATKGDWREFEKRLVWDNLDFNTIRFAFGSVHLINKIELPDWTKTLNECLKASNLIDINDLKKETLTKQNLFLDFQEPLPFEEILLPFIYFARQRLRDISGDLYNLLTQQAHANLERDLLKHLSQLCSLTFELEFSIFRANRQSTLLSIIKRSKKNNSTLHYQDFIKSLLQGELLKVFQEYPVLARLAAKITDLWIEAVNEFIFRLKSDWYDIQTIFQPRAKLGKVISVQPSLSDHHNNGRFVMAVVFESRLKLMYKPKDLGLEHAYFKLLEWFNQQNFPLKFKLLKIINRSNYGWVEFVESLQCNNKDEIKRYYQRSGVLLCLTYIFGGTDIHSNNIISSGEHPVLIDLETLMHPRTRNTQNLGDYNSAQSLANHQLLDSGLHSGLLPGWWFGPENQVYPIGGLGGLRKTIKENKSFSSLRLQHYNTDLMILDYEKDKTLFQNNDLLQDDINTEFKYYFKDVVNGFQQMYQFILKHRQEILSIKSPLKLFENQSVRFIFRTTRTYVLILKNTLKPESLRNGIEYSLQLDILSRGMLLSEEKPLFWAVLMAEKEALERMDIPLFTTKSSTDNLTIDHINNKVIKQYFSQSCFNYVISRLKQLNQEDLEKQIKFIWGSWHSYTTTEAHISDLPKSQNFRTDSISSLTSKDLVQQAIRVAEELQKQAICSPDGSVTWIAPQYYIKKQRFQFQTMGYNLYDGNCGVALFLAALTKITASAEFYNLAVGALQSLTQNVQRRGYEQIIKAMGIGVSSGYASFIYALVCVSQFLDEPKFLEDAQELVYLITPDLIAADTMFDVMSGSAGTILVLLALYNYSSNQNILDKAIICGHHLLKNRVSTGSKHKAWLTLKGKILTGFSHGSAGIAYSLLRLYQASSEIAFLNAAKEAIDYERIFFIPEINNWLDLRKSSTKGNPICMCSWCHGAPGIGLARVGGLDILDTDEIRQDIEAAIRTTKLYGTSNIDHLCCGNLGRIEFLLTASQKLRQIHLQDTAMAQTSKVVAYAEYKGGFSYNPSLGYSPGFFQGASGIGYELLRLAYPDLLPSILLFD